MSKKFKWVLEIKVDKSWVIDGFDFGPTNNDALNKIWGLLPYAMRQELSVRILEKPDRKIIRKMQGYTK